MDIIHDIQTCTEHSLSRSYSKHNDEWYLCVVVEKINSHIQFCIAFSLTIPKMEPKNINWISIRHSMDNEDSGHSLFKRGIEKLLKMKSISDQGKTQKWYTIHARIRHGNSILFFFSYSFLSHIIWIHTGIENTKTVGTWMLYVVTALPKVVYLHSLISFIYIFANKWWIFFFLFW